MSHLTMAMGLFKFRGGLCLTAVSQPIGTCNLLYLMCPKSKPHSGLHCTVLSLFLIVVITFQISLIPLFSLLLVSKCASLTLTNILFSPFLSSPLFLFSTFVLICVCDSGDSSFFLTPPKHPGQILRPEVLCHAPSQMVCLCVPSSWLEL